MIFDEYRKASKRHLQACDVLLGQLGHHSNRKKERILQETYYLTGYIFECIYKYALFALIGYDPLKNVEELNEDEINYRDHIMTHKFKALKHELDKRISGNIPFIKNEDGIDISTKRLYEKWNPNFRYQDLRDVDEDEIRKLYDWSKTTREKILENI